MKLLLEERNVPANKINYVLSEIIRMPQSPQQTVERPPRERTALYFKQMARVIKDELLRNETNFKLFMAIYYNDYKMFNYTIPALKS